MRYYIIFVRGGKRKHDHSTPYPESDFVKSNVVISLATIFHIAAVLNNIIGF